MQRPDLQTIVLATRNSGKAREFRALLAPLASQVLTLADVSLEAEFDESGKSFEVEGLSGRPGIHSARYAGPNASDSDRVQKLLRELQDSSGNRRARFVCALALAQKGLVLLESAGLCHGLITDEPRGTNGFGYDPVFLLPDLGKTFAELDEAEKNLHSHRARAVSALLDQLKRILLVNRQS
jgi:XTP/dITP diphosphohydrolase